jgi:hypothetical protein
LSCSYIKAVSSSHRVYTPILGRSYGPTPLRMSEYACLVVPCIPCLHIAFMSLRRLIAQDLTPNIGLYWYFFIEMFDHFRKFFLLVFQAHLACYAVPVTLKLRSVWTFSRRTCLRSIEQISLPLLSISNRFDPILAFTVLVGILATFKSYPSLGDTALYHSTLALYPELVPREFQHYYS